MLHTVKGKYLVEYVEAQKYSAGGLSLPDMAIRNQVVKSKVVAAPIASEECQAYPGDFLLFLVGGGQEIKFNDTKYLLVGEGSIIVVEHIVPELPEEGAL